jgi:hypothetical protein
MLGLMLFGKINSQERFILNTSASTPSNDGNFCGRVTFTVFNDNSFPIEIELFQKIPGSPNFTSPGTTNRIDANDFIVINSSNATIAGNFSYYALFTKEDGSFLSNTSLTPIDVIIYPRPVAGVIAGANEVCVGLTTPLTTGTITGGSGTYSSTLWSTSAPSKGTINATGVVTGVEGGTTSITYTVTDSKGCVSTASTVKLITVNALPTVTITNPSAVCAPSTVDLTATAITAGSTASLTYSYWTNYTATTSLTNANTISATGTYYIKGTSTLNCSVIKPVNTNINPIPNSLSFVFRWC